VKLVVAVEWMWLRSGHDNGCGSECVNERE